jgi:hypothetical protein
MIGAEASLHGVGTTDQPHTSNSVKRNPGDEPPQPEQPSRRDFTLAALMTPARIDPST